MSANSTKALIPYLNFNGNAADAMKFYKDVLGGELSIQTFGEAKMAETPEVANRVIHATLKNASISLMASDTQPNTPAKFGDNIYLSLGGGEKDGLSDVFRKLAEGGNVDMPLAKQFWGDTFGMVTDKFGVHWMVNISAS